MAGSSYETILGHAENESNGQQEMHDVAASEYKS